MVKLNKIYTRTGDGGTTALGDGTRVAKNAGRVDAMGEVDETNACVGLARVHTRLGGDAGLDDPLARIQNDLFDIGADLCLPASDEPDPEHALRLDENQVQWLETEIDRLNGDLKPLNSFVLPGGSPIAAALHLARTTTRRAERTLVGLDAAAEGPVSEPVIKYLNRLSDFLFVAARAANNHGADDVLWVPGQNRTT